MHTENKARPKKAGGLTWLTDLVFPPKCPFCRQILERHGECCPSCYQSLPWREGDLAYHFHPRVGLTCFAPLWYDDVVAQSFHRYKFQGLRGYALAYGRLMAGCLPADFSCDLICWAPLHKKRLRERGYDQARLLAEVVGEICGVPTACLLEKVVHTKPQSSLEEDGTRWQNAGTAYGYVGGHIAGLNIMLVDDLCTTGATLASCANVLKEQGAEQVFCLTLGWARK